MKARIVLIAILALFSASALAGNHYGNPLLNAAADLDRAAQAYAKQVHYHAGGSRNFNRAAERFARATANFCYLVDQGANIYSLEKSYERLETRFHRLHQYASSYKSASYGYGKVPDIHNVKYALHDVTDLYHQQYKRYAYGSDQYGYRDHAYKNRAYKNRNALRGRIGNGRIGLSFSFRD